MVDVSQLSEASSLLSEGQTIARALEAIDAAQPITMLMIGSVSVPATGLAHPPQMLVAIRAQLDMRLTQIKGRLAELGVSGDISLEVAPPEVTKPPGPTDVPDEIPPPK